MRGGSRGGGGECSSEPSGSISAGVGGALGSNCSSDGESSLNGRESESCLE